MDADTFIIHVKSSGLVEESKLQAVLQRMPVSDRARTVARYLVEKNLLTKFQAERLLMGKTDGFFMGQYRILDRLGKGGMGRVFKAEHMTMGRVVALKMLNSNLLKTEKARVLFEREVRAAAKLNHPNIVTAFDANQIGDRSYLVMEFVDGPNLQDLVKEQGPLPVTQACDFIRQAALGLQCAHDIGMVHRDIKPANLLVQKNFSKATPGTYIVKILDFGLARLTAPGEGEHSGQDSILTNKQTVMGTPDYLPPEQARNLHSADHRSDLYSLGCTFYFLLAGRVVFPGGTALEKMLKHTTDQPDSLAQLRPDLRREVIDIVEKLLHKNPEERFQSATELADALSKFADEGATWLTISPLPLDNQLAPVSGILARGRAMPTPPPNDSSDPWANLDDDLMNSSPTLSNQGNMTGVGGDSQATSRSRILPDHKDAQTWLILSWAILGTIAIGVCLAIVLIARSLR
jgi:serine/threonine-protein kinase